MGNEPCVDLLGPVRSRVEQGVFGETVPPTRLSFYSGRLWTRQRVVMQHGASFCSAGLTSGHVYGHPRGRYRAFVHKVCHSPSPGGLDLPALAYPHDRPAPRSALDADRDSGVKPPTGGTGPRPVCYAGLWVVPRLRVSGTAQGVCERRRPASCSSGIEAASRSASCPGIATNLDTQWPARVPEP
jgi:hypothetical protein